MGGALRQRPGPAHRLPRVDAAVLTPTTSWGSEDAGVDVRAARRGSAAAATAAATLDRYRPPFEFTADLLFVLALCPTAPLRRAFPDVPFLSVSGRTPCLAWFGRVKEGCAHDAAGEWRCEGGPDTALYHEVTVVAFLRRRALFVPGIYATSPRSTLIARHYYGMPKESVSLRLSVAATRFESQGLDATCRSAVRARLVGTGRFLARLLAPLWPLRVWPIRVPAGTTVRGAVLRVPRLRVAHVQAGLLCLDASWLPRPVPLLPIGVYAPSLRLRLFAPGTAEG